MPMRQTGQFNFWSLLLTPLKICKALPMTMPRLDPALSCGHTNEWRVNLGRDYAKSTIRNDAL